MIFTARVVEAPEALAAGLVSEVLPDHDAVLRRADEIAATIAANAPLTLQVTKEALRRVRDNPGAGGDDDLFLTCYMSRDFREGYDAFLNKRRPVWTGT
jgi:enoyl-CoA hydratase/carnithine racemase